jgi:hypothetical protein
MCAYVYLAHIHIVQYMYNIYLILFVHICLHIAFICACGELRVLMAIYVCVMTWTAAWTAAQVDDEEPDPMGQHKPNLVPGL